MEELGIEQILTFTIFLLFLAILVGLASRRSRVHYTVGLVIIGLGISLITHSNLIYAAVPFREQVNTVIDFITPEFILGLLVTPLLFISIRFRRSMMRPIASVSMSLH